MGKRRFAGTLSSDEHSTTSNKYAGSLKGHIRGWNRGVEVDCSVRDGRDVFEIYVTAGSNGGENRRHIATVYESGLVEHFFTEGDQSRLEMTWKV